MKKVVLAISVFENFTFKIGNVRVVENIFSEKKAMIYGNPIIFMKLVRSDNKENLYYKKHY